MFAQFLQAWLSASSARPTVFCLGAVLDLLVSDVPGCFLEVLGSRSTYSNFYVAVFAYLCLCIVLHLPFPFRFLLVLSSWFCQVHEEEFAKLVDNLHRLVLVFRFSADETLRPWWHIVGASWGILKQTVVHYGALSMEALHGHLRATRSGLLQCRCFAGPLQVTFLLDFVLAQLLWAWTTHYSTPWLWTSLNCAISSVLLKIFEVETWFILHLWRILRSLGFGMTTCCWIGIL